MALTPALLVAARPFRVPALGADSDWSALWLVGVIVLESA